MPEAYIVEAVRTPVGRKKGSLASVHAADLGAHALKAVVERSGIDPDVVEDVMFGRVDAIGPQAGNIARTAWLAAGYSEAGPGRDDRPASAARPSRPSTSPRRRSCRARTTWSSRAACRT
ncbi:thiolase family protein [Yinghuangia aomiensis]